MNPHLETKPPQIHTGTFDTKHPDSKIQNTTFRAIGEHVKALIRKRTVNTGKKMTSCAFREGDVHEKNY